MLAIDVGNTHITTGIFEGGTLQEVLRLSTQDCIESDAFLSLAAGMRRRLPDEAVMVSVRRQAAQTIVRELVAAGGPPPLVVDVNTPMGIEVIYDSKDTLGVDRLVCAAAAYHLHGEKGRSVVIIDMGTATTIDYVTAQGAFRGGMIAPGIMSAYEGLLAAAPQLPRIGDFTAGALIGTDTVSCVRSGVVTGHAAMIMKVVEMVAGRTKTEPVVVVTGGPSGTVRDDLPKSYIFDETLILKGLLRIHSLQDKTSVKISRSSVR
ncbi:MAG: type III pantothenate kinase [Deltaproteobacteria bacterium]|nr:type III pantothenate kinase [Deltaproteobacteria bacterium]